MNHSSSTIVFDSKRTYSIWYDFFSLCNFSNGSQFVLLVIVIQVMQMNFKSLNHSYHIIIHALNYSLLFNVTVLSSPLDNQSALNPETWHDHVITLLLPHGHPSLTQPPSPLPFNWWCGSGHPCNLPYSALICLDSKLQLFVSNIVITKRITIKVMMCDAFY